MAEHRMFSRLVTERDSFLDLSHSAQALYFHLGLNADDDGFVSSPRKIIRMCGACENDLVQLVDAHLAYVFENGVLVIVDWLVNNQIRADRYHATYYPQEKAQLIIEKGMPYRFKQIGNQTETSCQPNGAKLSPEVNLREVNLIESNLVESKLRESSTREEEGKGAGETHTTELCKNDCLASSASNQPIDDMERLKKDFKTKNGLL